MTPLALASTLRMSITKVSCHLQAGLSRNIVLNFTAVDTLLLPQTPP